MEAAFRKERGTTKEASMPALNEQMSSQGADSHRGRWIGIALVVAAVAVGIVLLAVYGGGGGSAPGY